MAVNLVDLEFSAADLFGGLWWRVAERSKSLDGAWRGGV
jgi:hypothetical protein